MKTKQYKTNSETFYVNEKTKVCDSRSVYELTKGYANKKQEHFIVLTLNNKNELIKKKVLYVGTVDACLFHPRDIFKFAILNNASRIIIIHNHPSGSLEGSGNDFAMTEQIKKAGELLNITLVDSLIISKEGYKSII